MLTVTIKFRSGRKLTYYGIKCIGMNGYIFDMYDSNVGWIHHDIRDIDWWDAA